MIKTFLWPTMIHKVCDLTHHPATNKNISFRPRTVIINDDVDETSLYSGGISTPEPDANGGGSIDDPNGGCRDEKEEKARLISQVLELQNTLDGMRLVIDFFFFDDDQKLPLSPRLRFITTC